MYSVAYKTLGGDAKRMSTTESALRVIREGLPMTMFDTATETVGSQKAIFAALIGASLRSLQRKKEGHLTPQQSEHTLAIINVYTSATEYFGNKEQAKKWMNTPQIIFGDKSGFEYLDTMTGIEYVSDVINRMKYGMTA